MVLQTFQSNVNPNNTLSKHLFSKITLGTLATEVLVLGAEKVNTCSCMRTPPKKKKQKTNKQTKQPLNN